MDEDRQRAGLSGYASMVTLIEMVLTDGITVVMKPETFRSNCGMPEDWPPDKCVEEFNKVMVQPGEPLKAKVIQLKTQVCDRSYTKVH